MNKFVSKELIRNDIENPIFHLEKMLDAFLNKMNKEDDSTLDKKEFLRACHILNAFCKTHKLNGIDLGGLSLNTKTSVLRGALQARLSKLILNDQKDVYEDLFKKIENSMSDEEYNHIQDLINNLREKIKKATKFDQDLQRRVLDKLNKLQAELDKDINKLELAKGRLLTIADMIGYAHEKALKPIIDSTIDLTNAIRGIEAKSNGMTDPNNQLTYNENIEDTEVIETKQIGM